MLANERQRIICSKVNQLGQVSVKELADEFGVSDETIRRDINYLHQSQQLQKVHGGAVSFRSNIHEKKYARRNSVNQEERKQIGALAAQMIEDHDIIALDSGVTVDALAREIYQVTDITILTASISALNILMNKIQNGDFSGKIIFLGGEVDVENQTACGSITQNLLKQFSIDKAFLSATSISEEGPYMYQISDAAQTSLMLKNASQSYLLAASNKFGKKSLYKICDLTELDYIISDHISNIPKPLQEKIKNCGIHLQTADSF